MSPLAVVAHSLGKAEVQGSNPCRGTTPKGLILFRSGNPRFAKINPGRCA